MNCDGLRFFDPVAYTGRLPSFRILKLIWKAKIRMIRVRFVWVGWLAIWAVAPGAWSQGGFPPATVVASSVVEIHHANSERFIGTITPIRSVTVGSAVAGRVTELFVAEGEHVGMGTDTSQFDPGPMGQPLAQLRTVTLDLEIAAARAAFSEQQQALKQLEISIPLEIETAQANVAEIESRWDYAKANYERLKQLNASGGGLSEREIQEAFSLFQAQSQMRLAAQATAKRLVATREFRNAIGKALVANREAELQRLEEQRENYTIRAPFNGYVVKKLADVGQWVNVGDPVFEMIQLDPIELIVAVPQEYIQSLQSILDTSAEDNQPLQAQIAVESVAELLIGEVTQIIPQADLRSRTFPVKITVSNPRTPRGHLLKSGMLARANFFVGREATMLMVKKDAIILGQQMTVAAIEPNPMGEGMVARIIPVEVGAALGDWIQVTGQLQPDQKVAIRGNERVSPGQPVVILSEDPDRPPLPAAPTAATGSPSEPSSARPTVPDAAN